MHPKYIVLYQQREYLCNVRLAAEARVYWFLNQYPTHLRKGLEYYYGVHRAKCLVEQFLLGNQEAGKLAQVIIIGNVLKLCWPWLDMNAWTLNGMNRTCSRDVSAMLIAVTLLLTSINPELDMLLERRNASVLESY